LGKNRIGADLALVRLAAFYGEPMTRKVQDSANDFIFDSYLTHFGRVEGLRLLHAGYSHLVRARRQEQKGRKMPGVTSPQKMVLREERQEPAFTGEDTDRLIEQLDNYLARHEQGDDEDAATNRPIYDLLKMLAVVWLAGHFAPAMLVLVALPAWKAASGYLSNLERGRSILGALVAVSYTERDFATG